MSIIRLLQDHGIDTIEEGNKHCSPGWINVHCPFCTGTQDYHLGYNLSGSYFHCWRCGGKQLIPTIAQLIGISYNEASSIIEEYGTGIPHQKTKEKQTNIRPFKFPIPNIPITNKHRKYLIQRKFNPEKLQQDWGIFGTPVISFLDGINFKNRIIAPIYWNGKIVSFQSRDITGRSKLKYITCPKAREIVHHKHILYGKQEAWKDSIICVEGIFDVWRLGKNAVSTFGIEFTRQQIRILVQNFKTVYIIFDEEKQAQEKAKKLQAELQFRGIDTERIFICGDPADMRQEEADKLVKKLGF